MTIEVNNLTKVYSNGHVALDDINFTFGGGAMGLLGPNGSGKTTLMRILSTISQPTSGSVNVMGLDISQAEEIRSMLGYLPQSYGFFPALTVKETMEYFASLKNVKEKSRIDELVEVTGLEAKWKARVSNLSGGQSQRLGIAVALLNPRLLIVDEPTAALDPEGRVEFRNLLGSLPGKRTIIISSHIIEDVTQSVWEVAILLAGRIIFKGSPQDLAEKALGKVWEVSCSLEELEQIKQTHYIVSTVRVDHHVRCRCIGDERNDFMKVIPSCEDGYIVLQREGAQ